MATDGRLARFRAAAIEPIDAAQIRLFRIGFGVLMTIATLRFFAHGWIAKYFLEPTHFFHYAGFSWVKPWPGAGMYVHFAVMLVAAIAVTLGYRTRISVAVFGVLFAYAHLIDKTNYLNHYYLVICLCAVMAALPLGQRTVPRWVLWLLRGQIAAVYIFGGLAKLNPDWLVDAQPMHIWLAANPDVPLVGPYLGQPWVAHVASIAGCVFDLAVVPLLLMRRTRPIAFVAVVAFHLATAQLFQLGMFPWIMMTSSLILFRAPKPVVAILGAPLREPRWPLVIAYAVVQVAMPLRSHLYPGNLLWTEQGFRFAWNVMLVEKQGSCEFRVTSPSTGKRWVVDPTDYYTRYQTRMASTQPDMILELAHVIADDFRARGVGDVEVRVDAFVSLNGRSAARLIDPAVDLARMRDGFGNSSWIVGLR